MQFNVPEMSCGHCTSTIEKAIKAADSGASLNCDLESRKVTVQSSLSAEKLAEVIKGAGYDNNLIAA